MLILGLLVIIFGSLLSATALNGAVVRSSYQFRSGILSREEQQRVFVVVSIRVAWSTDGKIDGELCFSLLMLQYLNPATEADISVGGGLQINCIYINFDSICSEITWSPY